MIANITVKEYFRLNCLSVTGKVSSLILLRSSSKVASTPDPRVQDTSSAFSSETTSFRDDYVIPATPISEDAYGMAPEFADRAPEKASLCSPSHTPEAVSLKPVATGNVTKTAAHQITSWLLLCPIPLPDHLKNGLAAYVSRTEAGADELLSILLRCLESIRTRVSKIYPGLCDEHRPGMDHHRCHCRRNEYGCMERRLDRLYKQSHIQQSEVLARCQHLLELCVNVSKGMKATSTPDSGNAPYHPDEDRLSIHWDVLSDVLSDRRSLCLNGSPLDPPVERTVPRADAEAENHLRKWELDLMMANLSQASNENILADIQKPKWVD